MSFEVDVPDFGPCLLCSDPVVLSGVQCTYQTAAGEPHGGFAHAGCLGVPVFVDVADLAEEVLRADARA